MLRFEQSPNNEIHCYCGDMLIAVCKTLLTIERDYYEWLLTGTSGHPDTHQPYTKFLDIPRVPNDWFSWELQIDRGNANANLQRIIALTYQTGASAANIISSLKN